MKYLPLLLCVFFLISCGGKKTSKKGSWTSDDMSQCIQDSRLGMASDPETFQMFEMLGEDMDDVINCFCKEFENNHASYAVAEIAADMMSEEEAGLMLLNCFSESTQKMMQLGLEMEGGDW